MANIDEEDVARVLWYWEVCLGDAPAEGGGGGIVDDTEGVETRNGSSILYGTPLNNCQMQLRCCEHPAPLTFTGRHRSCSRLFHHLWEDVSTPSIASSTLSQVSVVNFHVRHASQPKQDAKQGRFEKQQSYPRPSTSEREISKACFQDGPTRSRLVFGPVGPHQRPSSRSINRQRLCSAEKQ